MPRRSRAQIALDCGLSPGVKPSALQIRQSKELARARESSANTSNVQHQKIPKLKVPTSTSTTIATHSRLTTPSTSSKTSSKPISNPINLIHESDDLEVNKPANNPRFSPNDLDHLLELMGIQENQNCLFGSGSITAVDGMTRAGCWETLATLMNVYHNDANKKSSSNAVNKMKLTGDEMMKRWNRIKKRYQDTKKYFEKSTGTGLLDHDLAKGIDTTEKKKEAMCPRFEVIHEIIGHKSNITAHSILDTARQEPLPRTTDEDVINPLSVIDPSLQADAHDRGLDLHTQPNQGHVIESPTFSPAPPARNLHFDHESKDWLSSSDLALDLPSPKPQSPERSPNDDPNVRLSSPEVPMLPSTNSERALLRSLSPVEPNQNSNHQDGPPTIRQAARAAMKRKRGTDPVGSRLMKPLPSVNPTPGRHKAPGAALIKDRDETRFKYFDRKMEEKKKAESDVVQTQANIAAEALKWEKEKYENDRLESSRAESSKTQIQKDLANNSLNWEREKFTQENVRLVKAEEARVETERINTRREVMQACQMKGMSVQEMKDYMDLLFAK